MATRHKNLKLIRAAGQYLARKSDKDIARLLRLRGARVFHSKGTGRRLTASYYWKPWEIDLLGKHPDAETARRIGRGVPTVINKRKRLHIPIFDTKVRRWQKWELRLLGKHPDVEVARRTGRAYLAIASKRRKLRITLAHGRIRLWKKWEKKLLGTCTDAEFARRTGRTYASARSMRRHLGIKCIEDPRPRYRLPQWQFDLLGKHSDAEIARRTGRNRDAISVWRRNLGIERFGGKQRRWTTKEDKLLRQSKTNEEIARLTGRTIQGILTRRQKLKNPKKWNLVY